MTPRPPLRWPAFGRKTKVLLGFALVLITIVLLFDWNWLRAPVEHYLIEQSGREVRIDDLQVDLGFSLKPTVRLRGVHVENASWAAKRPLLTAGEVSFTFSLASVWRGQPVISHLRLVDGSADLERQADGLRNWRLRNPEDRGPGRVTVMTLEAHRSQVHFVNRAIDLEFIASATPAEVQNGAALPTRITFEGVYQASAFSGEALSGATLSFRDSGLSFPARGHIVSRATRLDFDGFFTDLFDIGPMDARVRLAGPSLALVHPFLRIRPPGSRPFSVEAQLTQTNQVFHFAHLAGKIGATPLTGDAVYDRSAARPMLRATMNSDAADFDDISPLLGMRRPAGGARADSAHSGETLDENDDAKNRGLFPARRFRLDAFRAIDVRVATALKKLDLRALRNLEDVHVEANLTEGLLETKRVDFNLAGGHATGALTFDARKDTPSARLSGELHGIRIERLLPALAVKSGSAGGLDGQINLSGTGSSIAALVGHSAGSFGATLASGRISNLADAKLGLDMGKVIRLFLRGDRAIAINCGAATFDVHDGVATSKKIALDTEETHVAGRGSIALRNEQLDLVLTPEPKKPGLFTRRASIRIQGPLRGPGVSIVDRVEQAVQTHGPC